MRKPRLPKDRTPWQMKWIVLAIFLFIVPYTWLTLAYRRPGPAYEPYAEAKDRANTTHLLAAGWQRLEARIDRPADPQHWRSTIDATAKISDTSPGVPAALGSTLVEAPPLPKGYSAITASGVAGGLLPYPVLFTCALADARQQLTGALLYVMPGSVVIVPQFEAMAGDLTARAADSPVLLTIPASTLKPGRYVVTLAGSDRSQQWPLEVR